MPLYEYLCKKCGHRFEKIRKFSDRPIRKCPECGGVVEQVVSAPAVQFKGSGWYVTDYPKKSSGGSSDSGSKDSKDSTESKDSKESKKDEKKSESSSSKESHSKESTKKSDKNK